MIRSNSTNLNRIKGGEVVKQGTSPPLLNMSYLTISIIKSII